MTKDIEDLILSNLIHNEEYYRKVVAYIKLEYFEEPYLNIKKETFSRIKDYFYNYNSLPTKDSILLDLKQSNKFNEKEQKLLHEYIEKLDFESSSFGWLIDKTEEWCKNRGWYNAVVRAIQITEGGCKNLQKSAVPGIMQDALGICFDRNIGHSYNDDYEQRIDNRKRVDKKIPFDIEIFNKITKGGLSNKTLSVVVAGTGVGKSLFMCSYAASCIRNGHNVLYITCEMSEDSIADRIDANLLRVGIHTLKEMDNDKFISMFSSKIERCGKMFIKEYPTSQASVNDFEFLLSELSLKKDFVPNIIFIDYINICSSSRIKDSGTGSYQYIKAIAEELRGLAVKKDVPIVTATQVNRQGVARGDIDITNVSESFGLPATADFMFCLISNESCELENKILIKQLKNRYNDINYYKTFSVGIDRNKMCLFNFEKDDIARPNSNLQEQEKKILELKSAQKTLDRFGK